MRFGADIVPGTYRDLDDADVIVLVGSNAAWCHPVLFQRMVAARRERGTKLVVVDPRRTATADEADLFLPIAPGMDTALFCGLLSHLADTRALNYTYIERHTKGFVETLARAREIAADAAATARAAGLKESEVTQFFKLFGKTERVVTCYSQGVNQSAQGTERSTPSLMCTWRPGASVAPAWDRSRSRDSPTRWADAKWAASPISSPPIWAFLPPSATASAAFGMRRACRG